VASRAQASEPSFASEDVGDAAPRQPGQQPGVLADGGPGGLHGRPLKGVLQREHDEADAAEVGLDHSVSRLEGRLDEEDDDETRQGAEAHGAGGQDREGLGE